MLHGHGDDIYSQNTAIKANFSSNVPDTPNMEVLQKFWEQKLDMLTSYPEVNAESFVAMLANKYALKTSQIIATHGATEAIYLMAQAFTGKSSTIFQPTFAEYADACSVYNHKVLHLESKNDLNEVDTQLVWLCNPNNPTGKVFNHNELLQIIDNHKDKIYIIDQTYRYFTTGETLTYQEAICRNNLVLIDSFTKRYAVPGLRLGYMVANETIIQKIIGIKPPWSVNQLAIETGKYLLSKDDLLPLDLKQLLSQTQYLQQALQKLPNIEVYPTDTHFFLCKLHGIKAQALKNILIQDYGILIRNADNFFGLDDYFIRIATQNKANNQLLIAAMKNILTHF